jgi:hypothetical protein
VALSEDQKAMLRLLAQREQGYDDLAALMGLSVDEVRARVKDALEQLEAEGKEAPDVEAPEPVAAEPTPAPEPQVPEPAASEEEPPPPPAEPPNAAPAPASPPPPAAPKAASAGNGRPKLSMPKDRGVQAAIGAGLLALIAIVVVLIVGGSDDSGSSGAGPSGGSGAATTAASESSDLTQAILSSVDGGDAEGRAVFGRVKQNVVLQVEATGLQPSPQGSSYAIWLYQSPKLALRVGAVKVTKSGGIAAQLPIPTELLSYVASGAFDQVDISLTENAAYAAEVARSKKAKQLPEHVGVSVLRGKITGPAIEAAAKETSE